MQVLGIAGSLRRGSYNRGLLEAARAIAPAPMTINLFDLAGIPLYNADLDDEQQRPPEVARLKQAIARGDDHRVGADQVLEARLLAARFI